MEKSYEEILKLLDLIETKVDVFKGSRSYLPDENTFVDSPAARDLIKRAESYSPENPLYVVAIGAITNIASALIINPDIAERMNAIAKSCHDIEKREDLPRTGGLWPVFHYHNQWIPLLAQALEAMARGQEDESRVLYETFRDCICRAEPEFQPWLDVYRILEVTQKYTGFHLGNILYGI